MGFSVSGFKCEKASIIWRHLSFSNVFCSFDYERKHRVGIAVYSRLGYPLVFVMLGDLVLVSLFYYPGKILSLKSLRRCN